jgi:putative exporter of polyketide antibiotics
MHASGSATYLDIIFLVAAALAGVAAAGQIAATRHGEAEGHVDHLVARRVGRLHWLAGRLLADMNIAPPALFVLGGGHPRVRLVAAVQA